ncbi:unnamed protein product [marine sediment metagenome]|uniref:Uncharacterized protein n=1 Tax=marine sediment metagenome TaxID=412755 RepID=X1EIJ9_9ZZZZ
MSKEKVPLKRCVLSWDGDQPVVSCPPEVLTEATRLIQTKGVLIKEVHVIEEVPKE